MSHSIREHQAAADEFKERIIERGHIYFLYRPKVGVAGDVKNMVDVQKLIMILAPSILGQKNRLLLFPKKKLPKLDSNQRRMAIIDIVSMNMDDLSDALKSSSYRTKTRGTHSIPPARLLGRGSYLITHHEKDNTGRLLYALDHPPEITPVQKLFNIEQCGHYIIALKNTDVLLHKHEVPYSLLDKYEGVNFIPIDNSQLLNVENSQIILIAGSKDIKHITGGEEIIERSKQESEADIEQLFKELHLSKSENPSEPLEGKLV